MTDKDQGDGAARQETSSAELTEKERKALDLQSKIRALKLELDANLRELRSLQSNPESSARQKYMPASGAVEDILCFIDNPKNLHVTVADGPVIDILESLRTNPNCIGNSVIAGAVSYYARVARYPPLSEAKEQISAFATSLGIDRLEPINCTQEKQNNPSTWHTNITNAKRNLQLIHRALLYRRKDWKKLLGVIPSSHLNSLPEGYFEFLDNLLPSERKLTENQWAIHLNVIENALREKYPEIDHRVVLHFLRNNSQMIPPHGGGNVSGAFKNAILYSLTKLDHGTVKVLRSQDPTYQFGGSFIKLGPDEAYVIQKMNEGIFDSVKTFLIARNSDLSDLVSSQ